MEKPGVPRVVCVGEIEGRTAAGGKGQSTRPIGHAQAGSGVATGSMLWATFEGLKKWAPFRLVVQLGLQKKWTEIGPGLGCNLGLGLEPHNNKTKNKMIKKNDK